MNPADIKILIVEDDAASAFILDKILTKSGYQVLAPATSGEEAIQSVREQEPEIILMDISIPGQMDGVETAGQIKSEYDIPLIYLTGFSDDKTIDRAKRTAPFAYILKPFREKEVSITIQMALYKAKVDRDLKASEQRLAVTLGSLHDGVISTGDDGTVTYLNPSAEIFTGCDSREAIGRPVFEVMSLSNRNGSEAIADVNDFLFDEAHIARRNHPLHLTDRSGQVRIVQLQTHPTYSGDDGGIHAWVIVIRDITERYHAEFQNRLLATALESLEDAVILTDPDLDEKTGPTIIHANAAFTKIAGYGSEEVAGKTIDLLFGKRTDRSMLALARRAVDAHRSFDGENFNYHKNGNEFIAQYSIAPVWGEDNDLAQLVFVIRDVTGLRQLEDNIRQSQKIEAIGRLAGGVAHDFNNLLSVINSYSDLLAMKIGEDSSLTKYVQNIRTAGQRGAGLVSQLMTFSRRESATPTLVSIPDLVEETEKMLRPLIRETIELRTELDSNTPLIKADPGQIEQILVNLCVNARDAMPDGGSITITSGRHTIAGEPGGGTGEHRRAGDYMLLNVADSGSGMDDEIKKHLFEPFFTTKDVGKGTGLGLSTVYGIVKQCGGYIEVDSKPGKGTRFDILIPAVREQQTKPSYIVNEDTPSTPGGSENILIVEDDETFSDCISGLLSLHGYVVHVASDGIEAVERFQPKAGELSIIIVDLVLPKLSGREVANRFLEKNPNLKVMFMTGYDDEADSFYDFPEDTQIMRKPFSLNNVLLKVREMLDGGAPVPPPVKN